MASAVDPMRGQMTQGSAGATRLFDANAAKSDSAELPYVTKWIQVTVAGNIKVLAAHDDPSGSGTVIPVDVGVYDKTRIRKIFATGTTATITVAGA